jgi:hypothetical protein
MTPLDPDLIIGVTLAYFQFAGKVPMEKNLLKRMHIGIEREVAVRERRREPILSDPVAFDVGSAVKKDKTS